jgi:hypothetical protein
MPNGHNQIAYGWHQSICSVDSPPMIVCFSASVTTSTGSVSPVTLNSPSLRTSKACERTKDGHETIYSACSDAVSHRKVK